MTALGDEIRALIAAEGPIGIDRYMALALAHPVHGYYVTRDPLGTAGDFTTAPEISQMFGELLGFWAAAVWTAMGRPDPVMLVELGPGRGTLMADALRAARIVPGFRDAVFLHLVELSPVLRTRQAAALAPSGIAPAFHDALDTVPAGPTILVANEFLDALPIRQFVGGRSGWHERLVGLDATGALAFGLAPMPEPALAAEPPDPGAVIELAPAASRLAGLLADRLVAGGGAALLVDYGHDGGRGDTLQAVRAHRFDDPLRAPGEADLTAHVDFAALARVARGHGARVHGPEVQGAFLEALGIRERADRLRRSATPTGAAAVDAALARLTGHGPNDMGRLFRAMALSSPNLPALPGLSVAASPAPSRPPERCPC